MQSETRPELISSPDQPRQVPEREAMAWPPSPWERTPSAWRDDVYFAPEISLPQVDPVDQAATRRPLAGQVRTLAREFAETILLTALIFVGIRFVVQNFRIEGISMLPTLHSDQFLLVNKLAYGHFGKPQRGDIVVFAAWHDDKDYIKRIIGVPGDRIELKEGRVWINGTPLDEPYLTSQTTDRFDTEVRLLGENEYYVMGDNRANSQDSRTHGPLPADRIIGKAWITYWPLDEIGFIPDYKTSYASTR